MGKYVFLRLDEMYIKEGLVYKKSTGALIGFSDLTGTLQEIDNYERKLENYEHKRPLAKTMFVMMSVLQDQLSFCTISLIIS